MPAFSFVQSWLYIVYRIPATHNNSSSNREPPEDTVTNGVVREWKFYNWCCSGQSIDDIEERTRWVEVAEVGEEGQEATRAAVKF